MNDTRDVTEDLRPSCQSPNARMVRPVDSYRQTDINQKVGIAAALEEDTKRRDEDGEEDFADVAVAQVCQSA